MAAPNWFATAAASAVRFDSKGGATLQIKMLVKIAGDVTKRRLAFAIPPALSSQVVARAG